MDVAKARAWLEQQIPRLIADTTTPVRVLALAALGLHDSPNVALVEDAVCERQHPDGWWAEPGTSDTLADQAIALMVASSQCDRNRTLAGVARLIGAQRKDGGWSASMGKFDHADATSTGLASLAVRFVEHTLKISTEEQRKTPGITATHHFAYEFLANLQDADTGALGHEGRVYGDWGSTAAGIADMSIGGFGQSLALRRAIVAVSRPEVLSRPAHDPVLAAWLACWSLDVLPVRTRKFLCDSLFDELARHQQPDGRWIAPKPSRREKDEYVTAAALVCLRLLDAAQRESFRPISLPTRRTVVVANLSVIVCIPAEKADTLLLDVSDSKATRLLTGYDAVAVQFAILRRSTDPKSGSLRPWAEAVAEMQRNLHAGPVSPATIPDFIADEMRLRPQPLLTPDDFTAILDDLDAKAEKRFAKQLGKIPVDKLFAESREAWASNDDETLARNIEAMIPDELRPAIAKLRERAAKRLAEELKHDDNALVLLDAWLALGKDGILSQLRSPSAAPPAQSERP